MLCSATHMHLRSSKAAQKGGSGAPSKHPQVLLLLIKQGANGLNLTGAGGGTRLEIGVACGPTLPACRSAKHACHALQSLLAALCRAVRRAMACG